MAFEAKLLTESKNKQAKLLRAAKKAAKEPDTGVKILDFIEWVKKNRNDKKR